MKPDDMQQVAHIARLAVLALCARGVAQTEHVVAGISEMVLTVSDLDLTESTVTLDFKVDGVSVGGAAL